MTTERRRPAKLPAWPVAAGTAGTFLAALAFLAGQVRDGRDAALGPAEPVAARAPREVVVRRVIRRVVITHPAPRAAAPALHELGFPAMGTRVRLLASAHGPLCATRAEVERLAARLTRFDPASELCRLNADPRPVVPASADLRAAVRAALQGARLTGGLADPTLLGALERAGYQRSLAAVARAPLRRAARALRGLRRRLRRRHPRDGRPRGAGRASVRGRTGRLDRAPRRRRGHLGHRRAAWGGAAHHLLDPATGRPAWTGVVTATALAPDAAQAEALAKAALLAGPLAGRAHLLHGGLLVLEDGGTVQA